MTSKIVSPRRLGAPALALAAALSAAAPALAASVDVPPPPPVTAPPAVTATATMSLSPATSPEAERLGRHIVHSVLMHADAFKSLGPVVKAAMDQQMNLQAQKGGDFTKLIYERYRPWMTNFGQASWDEFLADRPMFEKIVGHWMAVKYTAEELQAVADLCDSVAADEFYGQMTAAMADIASKKSEPKFEFSPAAKAAIKKFKSSPGGRAFVERSKEIGEALAKTSGKDLDKYFQRDPETTTMIFDLMDAWIPGVARRWGEKTGADENARLDAAYGPSTPEH
jgi:hypothetical protein